MDATELTNLILFDSGWFSRSEAEPPPPVARPATKEEEMFLQQGPGPVEARLHVLEQTVLDLLARVANAERHLEQHLDSSDPHRSSPAWD